MSMSLVEKWKTSFKNMITQNIKWFNQKNYIGSVNSISALLSNDVVLDMRNLFELYKLNKDVRQSVRNIANSVARNGLYLRDNDNQVIEDEALEDEIAELFRDKTFLKFKIDVFRNYLVSWELYIIPSFNPYWEVKWFEVLSSLAMEKVLDNQQNIIWYKYTTKDWQVYKYWLEDLAYFKLEDSIWDSNNGMWLLYSVIYDVMCDLEAERTNFYFYKNSAIPSAMLLLNDWMTKEQMQIAKDQFEAQFKWTTNQHKTMVAWNVKDFQVLAMSNRDMEFISQRKETRKCVCAAFGVPMFMLWYTEDSNYSNGREQRKIYIEWTVKPYANDFENILNTLLFMFRPDLSQKYYVKCDNEQLEETQEYYESQRKDVERWILTRNEVRIDRWLEPLPEENADKLTTSRNDVLLEDIALDAVLPANEV